MILSRSDIHLITVALSATIGAPLERVWRALIDPSERTVWDDRILGEVALPTRKSRISRPRHGDEPEDDRPGVRADSAVGEPVRTRWRFRLGGVPVVMQDETIETEPNERLTSRITIGSMHFTQTLTLHHEDDENGPRTRLGMKLAAQNSIAVLGDVVPRIDVQRLVIEFVDSTLRQVQKHCEADA
jgi:uncharacterized protein YndB with AHSA1/START domain